MIDIQSLIIAHPELLHNEKRLRAYMMDVYPEVEKRPQIDLLLLLLENGIWKEIESKSGLIDAEQLAANIAWRLSLDVEKTKQAVRMWKATFDALQNNGNGVSSFTKNRWKSKLAGVTFNNALNGKNRQNIIKEMLRSGMLAKGTLLRLVREFYNAYDPMQWQFMQLMDNS